MTLTLYTVGHGNRKIEELVSLLREAGVDTLVDVRAQPRSRHNPQFNDDALRLACENADIVYHWAGRQLGGMRTPRPDSPHLALDEGLRGFADHMDTEVFKKAAAQLQNLAAGSRGAGRLPSEAKLLRREDAGSPQETKFIESHRPPSPKEHAPRAVAAPSETAAVAPMGKSPLATKAPIAGSASPQALGASGVGHSRVCILCAERDPAQCHRSLIADYLTLQGMQVVHLVAPGETREHALSPAVRRESAALVYDRQVSGRLGLEPAPPGPKTR